jgi:CRP-like cAMP-binding protein
MVVSGRAAAYASHHADARQLAVLLPGSAFGHDLLVASQPSKSAIRALTPCKVWVLNRIEVEKAVSEQRSRLRAGRNWGWAAGVGAMLMLSSVLLLLAVNRVQPDLQSLVARWFPFLAARLAQSGTALSTSLEPLGQIAFGVLAIIGLVLFVGGLTVRRRNLMGT